MTEPSLFPDIEPAASPVAEKLSAGRRLTLRQRADVDAGRHPLMRGLSLRGGDETCGSCGNLTRVGHHTRTYLKCELRGATHSEATDCRAWWPACTAWKPSEGDS